MNADNLQDRMLSAIMPEHNAEPPARWQQRKSAQTRQRLVEAGVDCLVEGGYSGLTTAAVAERCAVSRGAMHHHFPTRLELVAAVVEHVFYQRMRRFLDDYFAALKERGEELMIEIACEAHWQSVQTREYAAYLELLVAARSDAELAALFQPAARQYDEVWTREMIEAFPQWERHWQDLKLASDFTQVLHMGLLLHRTPFADEARREQVRQMGNRVVRGLYDRK
ncbi:MAG: TetR/AcrR family transcriptional regulator [Sphingomonadales bacterium]|nr:TetR/AcrR family transcriptional regulator [Sphingomonadales bacterium]